MLHIGSENIKTSWNGSRGRAYGTDRGCLYYIHGVDKLHRPKHGSSCRYGPDPTSTDLYLDSRNYGGPIRVTNGEPASGHKEERTWYRLSAVEDGPKLVPTSVIRVPPVGKVENEQGAWLIEQIHNPTDPRQFVCCGYRETKETH